MCVISPHYCRLEEARVQSEASRASVCSGGGGGGGGAFDRAAAFRNRFYSIITILQVQNSHYHKEGEGGGGGGRIPTNT